MTTPNLRERLSHVVAAAEDNWISATSPFAGVTLLAPGVLLPLSYPGAPPGWADVWVHQRAADRHEQQVLSEAGRRDVDESSFDDPRLDHLASWDHAQLDPPHPGEEPEYPETEARAVAVAALKHQGLPANLVGKHLLFCRYTYGATRKQPVWLAMYNAHGAEHLIVINADSDLLLEPVTP